MQPNTATFQSMQRFQYGPDWRWSLAQRGNAGGVPEPLLAADGPIQEAMGYLGLLAQGNGEVFLAMRSYPQVHAAVGLWQTPLLRTRLKILAVGGCPTAEIAARLGLEEAVVEMAMSLFFDVTPQLQARDWVLCKVIAHEKHDGGSDLATHLRLAYFGGPLVAQMIVDAPERLPAIEVDRLCDQSMLLHTKAQEALAVPLRDPKSVLTFLKMFMDYKCKTDALDLAREKFRHRCEQEIRRNHVAEAQAETMNQEPVLSGAMPKVA